MTKGKPLFTYKDGDVASVCGGCKLVRSKPEVVPDELRDFVGSGFRLAEINNAGGTFEYPDALTPLEWASLTTLKRGQSRADATERKRREKKK